MVCVAPPGKTTLINCLTLSAFGGVTRGSITLGNEPLTPQVFKKQCYAVNQRDFHWAFLTCRETMLYAAKLYLGSEDADQQVELVNHMITKMGLDVCADVRVGNEFVKGLSGGQKRRLSLGLALIKEPLLIYLDEPTSGLDAAAAVSIMNFIKDLAQKDDLIVVATIHQPSTRVYEGFDQVMILSKGHECYSGPADKAMDYFGSIGYPMPAHTNPAEFFLDLVNSDFVPDEEVDKIITNWRDHRAANNGGGSSSSSNEVGAVSSAATGDAAPGVGLWAQTMVMLDRHGRLALRDPFLYLGRGLVFFVNNVYFAVVYLKARKRHQDQVTNRFWLIVWFIGEFFSPSRAVSWRNTAVAVAL